MTTAASDTRNENGSRVRGSPQRELRTRMQALEAAAANPADLRHLAEVTTAEVVELRARLDEMGQVMQRYQQEVQTLTAPPYLPAVITRVSRNGHVTAEVHSRGGARMRVALHEDVNPELLKVGSQVLLNHHRTCVLSVDDCPAEIREVGIFERRIDAHTILVKHQESSVPVLLAEHLREESFVAGEQIGFDREVGVALARLPAPDRSHWFTEEYPDDDFASLAGLDEPISLLKRAVDRQLRHPQLAAKYKVPARARLLLDGPPGNGKTKLARCLAAYISHRFPGQRCRFMVVAGSEDYSMWFGQSEAQIRERFFALSEAAAQGPAVLFMDEVEALARRRFTDAGSSAPDRTLNQVLSCLDGFRSLPGVIIVAATNRADMLDPAFVRPGRFHRLVRVPAPNRITARGILGIYLGQERPLAGNGSVDELIEPLLSALYAPRGSYGVVAQVRLSDNRRIDVPGKALVSGAMLEEVCTSAAEAALDREADGGACGITHDDLQLALQQQLRGVCGLLTPANVKSYVASLPQDAHPVSVEIVHRELNVAAA